MSAFRGWLGERVTALGMWLWLRRSAYHRFHNIIVPAKNGTTQIDHLVVSAFGVFVVETKNMKGWIFGSEDQSKWTQSLYGKNYSFQNPLHQNFRHIRCLANHLGLDESLLHSVVVFVGECAFKTPMPPNVIRSGLSSWIRGRKEILLSDEEIQRVCNNLRLLRMDHNLTHSAHLKSLRERHGSTTTCPKCGSSLLAKTARRGVNAGSTFLRCSSYPRCRFTRPV